MLPMLAGLDMQKTSSLHTGLGMFCLHLGRNLLAQAGPDDSLAFYLPEKRADLFGKQARIFLQKPWHKWLFPASFRTDVWHCCHQDSPYFPRHGTPVVLTIHDLNFMSRYSGWRKEWRRKKLGRMMERSAALVAISAQTGHHMEEVYGLSSSDYQVIYNGNSLQVFPGNLPSASQGKRPFLLCLGVLSERKNAHVLCGMLARLPDYDLILAGPSHEAYRKKILEEAARWKLGNRLIFAGEVSEEEKYRLLQNAEALLFPSLAEGFGLPVVEAMSLGKPVFLSRYGSLPEIGGREAFYWESFDPDGMAALVREKLSAGSFSSEALKKRASLFSWENAAASYLDLYRSLA